LAQAAIWEFKFTPLDILGYLGISWDMIGYQKISKDIFGDSGYHLAAYPKQISHKDIPGYPYISHRYPTKISHNDILQCYPDYILIYPYLSFLNIQYISNHICMEDSQRISQLHPYLST
jgi:hypothetical protein